VAARLAGRLRRTRQTEPLSRFASRRNFREHDGMVPTDDDKTHFESLPVPLALWEPFQQCLSKHLSELTEGQIDLV
jgi:hypothetical protein